MQAAAGHAEQEREVRLPQPPPAEAREIRLALGAELARCEVDDPHFFYDETEPRPQDIPELKHLANCLTAEPFEHVDLLLVGRADQRGTSEYNEQLAKKRAEYVKRKLVEYGVPGERIGVISRGEQETVGDEPWASHGYDRRVDIVQLSVVTP